MPPVSAAQYQAMMMDSYVEQSLQQVGATPPSYGNYKFTYVYKYGKMGEFG